MGREIAASERLNCEIMRATTPTTKASQSALDRSDTLLQLPYDRLKTPQTEHASARLPEIASSWLHGAEESAEVVSAANAAAVCGALFYRYSGQAQFPLVVRSISASATESCRLIDIEVCGQTPLARLQERALLEIQGADEDDPGPESASILVSVGSRAAGSELLATQSSPQSIPDIHLIFVIDGNRLMLTVDYNSALFFRDTIAGMRQHLIAVIDALILDDSTAVADIDLFSEDQRDWIDGHCEGRIAEYSQQPIHADFEKYAALDPQKIAVRCGETSLSYEDLNRRANQIAWLIGSKSKRSGGRVVVCLDPSVDVAAVLLGILKSGMTYVPVNPGHPVFRIEAVLEDTKPLLVITQSHLAGMFDAVASEVVRIDQLVLSSDPRSTENPDNVIGTNQIAYAFYTSGTTGKPKGVLVSHSNMIHSIRASRDRYQISALDIMPAVASYTFSISMFELMSPLSVGGTLLVLERDHVLDARRMADTLGEVTLFHIGPSLLKNIVGFILQNDIDFSTYSGVRHASSGGDMVPPELVRDLRDIFSDAEIYVIYGCSEISLMGCTWEVPASEAISRTFVGQPFANVQLHILDDDGNRVPRGSVGDVCFGGDGVVTGYLNRPELQERLFFERNGIRLYRTGDRGRLSHDGQLELMGRRDFQIQLHGMRIELAEIDYHLRQADGVRDGIVAARERHDGSKVLVAYYVAQEPGGNDIAGLRSHLTQRLPEYMVPTYYVQLDALPLNHNLKVDRNSLPDYVFPESRVENPPQTPTEVSVAKIWCELLHLNAVDVGDNFMALGGDSLLAMQLIMSVEQVFSCRLDGLEVLRESLSVMAQIIDDAAESSSPDESPRNRFSKKILPLSSFYFGENDSLYGLYQSPVADADVAPVLICPPVGYEYMSCQYFLRLLAENLASVGVASLSFDFFGSGDSCGLDRDATMSRWRADIVTAYDELARITGSKKIRVFCFRFNSLLAFDALHERSVERWVCWDPVTDGSLYYEQLRRMSRDHALQQLVVRNLRMPSKIRGAEELVGTMFSSAAIDQMVSMKIDRDSVDENASLLQVLSGDYWRIAALKKDWERGMGSFPLVTVSDECGWYSLGRVGSAITHRSLLECLKTGLSEGLA